LRVLKNDYIIDWEENRKEEMKQLTSNGVILIIIIGDPSRT
jgi:hypothetical protein